MTNVNLITVIKSIFINYFVVPSVLKMVWDLNIANANLLHLLSLLLALMLKRKDYFFPKLCFKTKNLLATKVMKIY